MGMFDYLKCDYPLPDFDYQDALFQTKDLDCFLETYTITKEGILLAHRITYKTATEEELLAAIEARSDLNRMEKSLCLREMIGYGSVIPDKEWDELLPYHGDIYFYDFDKSGKGLVTFKARFAGGRVAYIVKIDWPPPAR